MIKKFPQPPQFLQNTDITIVEEIDGEDGVEDKIIFSGKGYYEESIKRVLNENKQLIELSGVAIVYKNISYNKAYIKINDKKRIIYSTSRPRNPDGTVYATEMELI